MTKVSTKDEENWLQQRAHRLEPLSSRLSAFTTGLFWVSVFFHIASTSRNRKTSQPPDTCQLSQVPNMSRQLSIRFQPTLASSGSASSPAILYSSSLAASYPSASSLLSPSAIVASRVHSAATSDTTTRLSAATHPTIAPTAARAKSVFTRRHLLAASRLSPLPTTPPSLVFARNNRLFSTTTAVMVARQLDGTAIAKAIRERIGAEIAERQKANPRYKPCLKIIQSMFARLD